MGGSQSVDAFQWFAYFGETRDYAIHPRNGR
jgi:hypothetical protein